MNPSRRSYSESPFIFTVLNTIYLQDVGKAIRILSTVNVLTFPPLHATFALGLASKMVLRWEIRIALSLALFIRTGMILYGVWQDKTSIVKFTDVDYTVFTDAAEYVTEVKSVHFIITKFII